jgi:hypothetical protein
MIRSIAVVSTTAIRRNHRLGLRLVSQSSTRISHHPHPALSTVVAAAAAESQSSTNDSHWIFLASLAGIAAAPLVLTSCDDNKTDKVEPDSTDIPNSTEEEEEDPYDNLPEKDEPTHCSICMTYRQGPCRPYWRKVEACTKEHELPKGESKKDNEEEEDKEKDDAKENDDDSTFERDEAPCFKYMLPWIECATGFRNLYNFIELDTNYTAGIVELEKDASEAFCWAPQSTKEPQVDWTAWRVYVDAHPDWKLPPKKKKTSSSTSSSTSTSSTSSTSSTAVSLWKTLDQTKDPEAIEVTASVAVKDGRQGGVLECAYAVDQDNHVIGFAYGTKPSQAAASAALEGEEEDNSTVTLKIGLLPTHTRTVTIAAAYTQPATAAAAKDAESKAPTTTTTTTTKEDTTDPDPPTPSLDSHIYKSRPFSLKQMGKKKTTSSSSSSS